jgi:hypothetical protein
LSFGARPCDFFCCFLILAWLCLTETQFIEHLVEEPLATTAVITHSRGGSFPRETFELLASQRSLARATDVDNLAYKSAQLGLNVALDLNISFLPFCLFYRVADGGSRVLDNLNLLLI